MIDELTVWTAIVLIASVTLASRLVGSFLMSHVNASARIERFLDGLSVAVIAALVASILAQNGFREAAAVALAVLVMLRSANATWAMIAGVAVAALWTHFLSM